MDLLKDKYYMFPTELKTNVKGYDIEVKYNNRLLWWGGRARLNAQVSKTCMAEMSSRVRISPPPPSKKSILTTGEH